MDHLLFKFLLVQVLEKLLRLSRFLERADIEGRRSDLDVIRTFRRRVEEVRASWDQARRNFITYSPEPNSDTAANLVRQISSCQHDIDDLHLNLSYIKGPWTCPETDVFVTAVFDSLGVALQPRPSVVLSDVYVFEETDLASYLAPKTLHQSSDRNPTPTLFLPKLEFENPLQWSMLIHEMGHAIRETQDDFFTPEDFEAICGQDPRAKEMLSSWLEELYEDLVATHLLGPAYLASFVELVTLVGSEGTLESSSDTHPHSRLRLYAMYSMLNRRGVRCSFDSADLYAPNSDLAELYYWLYEKRCFMEREYVSTPLELPDSLPINTREFISRLETHVLKVIPIEKSLSPFDPRKFSHLSKRLESGIPIGSYSPVQIEHGDEAALKALKILVKAQSSNAQVPTEELEEPLLTAMARIKETPCTVAEIINAGWIYKCEKVYQEAIRNLANFTHDDEERFRSQVFALDALLRNSIETSFLSKLFIEHIDKKEAR